MLERLAASDAPPGARDHPPRPARGPRPAAGPPPVAERARALGLALEQPESVNDPEAGALIAAALADGAGAGGWSSCAPSAR